MFLFNTRNFAKGGLTIFFLIIIVLIFFPPLAIYFLSTFIFKLLKIKASKKNVFLYILFILFVFSMFCIFMYESPEAEVKANSNPVLQKNKK